MSLSKLLAEYKRLHDESEVTGESLQTSHFRLTTLNDEKGEPVPSLTLARRYLRNRIEWLERKYRKEREEHAKKLEKAIEAERERATTVPVLELARRDVAEAAKKYEPTTPVTGYRNTLGDWVQ